jgi:hypothetical protein
MKSLVWLVLLASCTSQANDYPILPGGQVPPVVTSSIASGRICIVADPRVLTNCSTDAAGGLAVSVGGSMTTTAADGSFVVPASAVSNPANPTPLISVTGPGVVPTQTVFAPDMSIPLLRADLFSQMLAANGVTPRSGSGSILGSVVRDGVPASGVSVTSTPSPAFGPLFDGSTPTAWVLDATGARGVVWIPGIAMGPAQLTFRDLATSGETTVAGVTVIDGGITIMDAVLP